MTAGDFAWKARSSASRFIECLAERDATRSGDLLAYLLFDGAFAAKLIELGRNDAAAHHDDLCDFLAPAGHGLAASFPRPAVAG